MTTFNVNNNIFKLQYLAWHIRLQFPIILMFYHNLLKLSLNCLLNTKNNYNIEYI